jgi:phage gp16-like protein
MLRKIIVLAGSRGKAYVDGMCRRMFHVDRLEFADEAQLHAIVSALTYDAQRHPR